MKENRHVIYIIIDGFARYYFDELIKDEKSKYFLNEIIKEGVFFENIFTTLPSITNPCQNMLLSGATSKITKNVYRHYDKKNNIVIQQTRENEVDLITKYAIDKGLSVVSIAHYLTEEDLTNYDNERLYLGESFKTDDEKYYDYEARFNQLLKVINKEPISNGKDEFIIKEFPNLIVFYCDDLDGIGHNFDSIYGSVAAKSETKRLKNVVARLKLIDKKIAEVVEALKSNNLYDKTRIFITTDHGMSPYGKPSSRRGNLYEHSKISDLFKTLKEFDSSFKIEFLSPNERAKKETNLVVVGANLNVQLSFLKPFSHKQQRNLQKTLLTKDYIYAVKTTKELKRMGYWTEAADLIISPKSPYHFSKNLTRSVLAKAQHDTLDVSSNHVVGWIFGGDTKHLGGYKKSVKNYDFGVTVAKSLNIKFRKFNGKALKVFK